MQQQQHQRDRPGLSDWLGNLSRRLQSLPQGSRHWRRRAQSNDEIEMPCGSHDIRRSATAVQVQEVQEAAAPAAGTYSRRHLSHRERHEINLMYHLLRDHRDALQLQGACQLQDGLLMVDNGDEQQLDDDEGSWLCWWSMQDGESYAEEAEAFNCETFKDGDGSDCDVLSLMRNSSGMKSSPVNCPAEVGSDSCLSSSSSCSCSKRFKHKRRTERWNQEYDWEFKEKHGFIDLDYARIHQIK